MKTQNRIEHGQIRFTWAEHASPHTYILDLIKYLHMKYGWANSIECQTDGWKMEWCCWRNQRENWIDNINVASCMVAYTKCTSFSPSSVIHLPWLVFFSCIRLFWVNQAVAHRDRSIHIAAVCMYMNERTFLCIFYWYSLTEHWTASWSTIKGFETSIHATDTHKHPQPDIYTHIAHTRQSHKRKVFFFCWATQRKRKKNNSL